MEETKEVKKLSYEELERVAQELNVQCQKMYADLQNANMTNAFKRLDYLFKVVEFNNRFPEEFVTKCANEICMTMELPEESETNEEA